MSDFTALPPLAEAAGVSRQALEKALVKIVRGEARAGAELRSKSARCEDVVADLACVTKSASTPFPLPFKSV